LQEWGKTASLAGPVIADCQITGENVRDNGAAHLAQAMECNYNLTPLHLAGKCNGFM